MTELWRVEGTSRISAQQGPAGLHCVAVPHASVGVVRQAPSVLSRDETHLQGVQGLLSAKDGGDPPAGAAGRRAFDAAGGG